jgi:hypothetical protein
MRSNLDRATRNASLIKGADVQARPYKRPEQRKPHVEKTTKVEFIEVWLSPADFPKHKNVEPSALEDFRSTHKMADIVCVHIPFSNAFEDLIEPLAAKFNSESWTSKHRKFDVGDVIVIHYDSCFVLRPDGYKYIDVGYQSSVLSVRDKFFLLRKETQGKTLTSIAKEANFSVSHVSHLYQKAAHRAKYKNNDEFRHLSRRVVGVLAGESIYTKDQLQERVAAGTLGDISGLGVTSLAEIKSWLAVEF